MLLVSIFKSIDNDGIRYMILCVIRYIHSLNDNIQYLRSGSKFNAIFIIFVHRHSGVQSSLSQQSECVKNSNFQQSEHNLLIIKMLFTLNLIIYILPFTIKYNTRTRDTNIRHNNKHDKLIS